MLIILDMNSKLGNYFSKGVKVGVLTAAVLMGAVGCQNVADDQQEQEQFQDLDSYIFLRHRFAEENATISSGDSEKAKIAWSNKHFKNITDYMSEKVADFKHKVRDLEPAGNFLQPLCDEIWADKWGDEFNGYENGGSGLDLMIDRNNLNYTKFLGAMGSKLVIDGGCVSTIDFEKLKAHYAALAVRAYNDSLGSLHDSDRFQFNRERQEINAALQGESVNAPYLATDYTLVEQKLLSMLNSVSCGTGVSVDTLIDAVNLNLLNASMWGARDLAATAGFQLSSANTKLLSPQLPNLNRRNLLHNVGSWRNYRYLFQNEQQNNQEQSNGL